MPQRVHRKLGAACRIAAVSVGMGAAGCSMMLGFEDPVDLVVDATSSETDAADADANGATEDAGEEPVEDASVDDPAPDVADASDEGSIGGAVDAGDAPPDASEDATADAEPPPVCATSCVAAPPDGWDGPLALHEALGGPPAPTPPACDGDYATLAYDGFASPVAPPAICACTCGPAQNVTCTEPEVKLFSDGACTSACGAISTSASCSVLDPQSCGIARVLVSPSVPAGGACAPSSTQSVPAAGWSAALRLCRSSSTTTTGCASGKVCAPRPRLPFSTSTLCVAHSGVVGCPSDYPSARVYYGGGLDTRACGACTCGSPEGASCEVTQKLCSNDRCGGSSQSLAASTCTLLGSRRSVSTTPPTPTGGACAASGGAALGAFTPTMPTTICCTE